VKLDLSEIALNTGKRIKYVIDEEPIEDIGEDVNCVAPLKGEVVFGNTGSHIVVRGRFVTKIDLSCSRCLKRFSVDLDLTIEEELPLPGYALPAEEESEEEEFEDVAEPSFVDNVYDLSELLRQSILLAVPIRSLCSETCKGLCSHCGKNRNDGPCDCPPEAPGSAFADLAALLKEEKEES